MDLLEGKEKVLRTINNNCLKKREERQAAIQRRYEEYLKKVNKKIDAKKERLSIIVTIGFFLLLGFLNTI